jgi:hypothetical protein
MAMLSTKKFDSVELTNDAFRNDRCYESVGKLHLNDRLEWPTALANMYDAAIEKYREGVRGPEIFFTLEELTFLASIGCSPQELYRLVEDWCELWASLHGCED